MKRGQLSSCLSFIRFSLETDGKQLNDEQEEVFTDILNDDVTSDSVVEDWIRANKLKKENLDNYQLFSFYPGTRVPVNYFGIKNKDKLSDVDHVLSMFRLAGLFTSHVVSDPLSIDLLKVIHKEMFKDVYPTAGMLRIKEAAKRTEFASPDSIQFLLEELFTKLRDTDYLSKLEDDDDDFINELAYIMGELEAIHPFADGNGRIIRLFISLIAQRNGYGIDWSSADPDQFLEASIASIDGDYQALVDTLEEICYPLEEE